MTSVMLISKDTLQCFLRNSAYYAGLPERQYGFGAMIVAAGRSALRMRKLKRGLRNGACRSQLDTDICRRCTEHFVEW